MREFLRGAVRLHILHHAAQGEIHGAWMATELAQHGYRISPGSLYPTLHKMEAEGLLRSSQQVVDGRAAPFLRGDGRGAQGAGVDQAPAAGAGPMRCLATRPRERRGRTSGTIPVGTGSSRTDRQGVAASRLHRVRRTPDPHRPAPPSVRRGTGAGSTRQEFEDAIAATNLLPGPASTQLAIYCAWRLRGAVGAVLGGLCFIVPGLVLILALSAVFLAEPPATLGPGRGGGGRRGSAGRGAARRVGARPGQLEPHRHEASRAGPLGRLRPWLGGVAGGDGRPLPGARACGLRGDRDRRPPSGPADAPGSVRAFVPAVVLHGAAIGGLGALAWVAFKVGALSYGGGFVIVPLMQHDAVTTYHWMTGAQFLNAVALGQVTPGPVVQTVAVVGYAAGGVGGGLLAAADRLCPFVRLRPGRRPRTSTRSGPTGPSQSFLTGAGPAVIGAIAGSAVPLGLAFSTSGRSRCWRGLAWLFVLRRGVVERLLIAGAVGAVVALAGAPA